MNPSEIDWKAWAHFAIGGGIVLLAVCVVALAVVREFWLWVRGHLGTFDALSATAKGGKIQLGAVIEDMRVKVPEQPKPEAQQNGVDRSEHLNLS